MTTTEHDAAWVANGDGSETLMQKSGWHLHGANPNGVSFRSGYLDGAEIDKVLDDFIQAVRPVLKLTPFALDEISIRLSYTSDVKP